MENPLKDCITIRVSTEEVNSPDFDLANYLTKKFNKEWLKKTQEFYRAQYHLPLNNVNES